MHDTTDTSRQQTTAAADDQMPADLVREVTGEVLVPGHENYSKETALYNLHMSLVPDVVVVARDADDVRAAVRYAAARRMPIAVKATGHQIVLPAEGGLLINTDRLKGLTIDAERRTARAEAGVRWEQVLGAAAPHGLSPMPGSTPHVGVVGYLLGGGLSPVFGRSKGYAADHVLSLDVVTVDGHKRTVTADSDPDLFWAMRGCKGNFGIVTAIEFELFPVTHMYGGGLYFAGEHLSDVLHAWRTWVPTLPEEATSSVAVQRLPELPELPKPLRGAFLTHVRFTCLSGAEQGKDLLAPMREVAPVLVDTVADMPIAEMGSVHSDPIDPLPYWERQTSLRELPAEAVDAFVGAVGKDSGCELLHVELRHLEGALGREAAMPNSVPTRDVPYYVFGFGVGPLEREELLTGQLEGFVEALRPWASPHLVANFLSPEEAASPQAMRDVFGAEKYDRLVAVKNAYDPHNLLRVNHNVRAV